MHIIYVFIAEYGGSEIVRPKYKAGLNMHLKALSHSHSS